MRRSGEKNVEIFMVWVKIVDKISNFFFRSRAKKKDQKVTQNRKRNEKTTEEIKK